MTLTVGRCTDLRPAPRSPSRSSRSVTVTGTVLATSIDDLTARRDQLLGLANNVDDPVVPVTWSTDPSIDGFYSVNRVSVEQIGTTDSARARFAIELEEIDGRTAPLVEADASAVVRTNGCGATDGEPTVVALAYHSSASTYEGTGAGLIARSGEDGDVYLGLRTAPFTEVYSAFPSIANRYAGTCKIEVKYGSTWYPVVGQQVPASAAGNWRISNGLVRLSYSPYTGDGGATVGGLLVEVYDSGAWRTAVTAKLGTWDGSAFSDANWAGDGIASTQSPAGSVVSCPLRVLRNSPETVTVGFHKRLGATQYLTLNQGAMFATLTTRALGAVEPFIRPVGAESGNGYTGAIFGAGTPGYGRLTDDANGNRYLFLYTPTAGAFQESGGVRHGSNVASNTAVSMGIGVILGGGSAGTGNTGYELAQQYVGQAAWRQRVVVR
jgi:hypothetical protein